MGNVWEQQLPTGVKIWNDRRSPVIEACRGKKVIHIGCCDAKRPEPSRIPTLHEQLKEVADSIIGLDNSVAGISAMRESGLNVREFDLEKSINRLHPFGFSESENFDIVVAPEVIEHLTNISILFDDIAQLKIEAIITTPNAFSWRILNGVKDNIELVHPDHVHYFSAQTLKAACERHGLTVDEIELYNYGVPNDPDIVKLLQTAPFFSEGLIFYLNGGHSE